MLQAINDYHVILGSNSPRRRELLAGLDIDFEVKVVPGIEESYPDTLSAGEIPLFLARKKAEAYRPTMSGRQLVITADTIVCAGSDVLGKPATRDEAIAMLRRLSGGTHQVVTGVCLSTRARSVSFSVTSEVTFASLTHDEIVYYVDKYKPYDKAGAYGIQEWIGYVGVESIHGSFYNVMGLPVQRLYSELKQFVGSK